VLELEGLAAAPYCGLVLADFGADVVRVDRATRGAIHTQHDLLGRGKRRVELDLRDVEDRAKFKQLAQASDVVLEPYRPGVMEKLGIGPEVLLAANPRLVYARLTGYGQSGANANKAGHDLNYLALSGTLDLIPGHVAPGNILGDFAAGGQSCAMGIVMALLERERSGRGQVVDAGMVPAVAYLSTFVHRCQTAGLWNEPAGQNALDGGAPFYTTYDTADGGQLAVGCIEPGFYAEFLNVIGIDPAAVPPQHERSGWPELRRTFAATLMGKSRAEWEVLFDGTEACVTPVLSPAEAAVYPGNENAFAAPGLPAPAPLLQRTPARVPEEALADAAVATAAGVLEEWTR